MPAEIEITNANTHVVIDGSYSNLALSGKGTLTLARRTNASLSDGTLTVTSRERPIVAFRCAVPVYMAATASGTTWTFTFTAATTEAVSLTYYLFDTPTGSSTFGGQVFDGAGKLVFDAALKYMRIIGTAGGKFAYQDPIEAGFSQTYTGKTIALCQGLFAVAAMMTIIPGSGPPGQENYKRMIDMGMAATTATSTASYSRRTAYSDGPYRWNEYVPFPHQPYYNWLVLDVTDY